MSDKPLNRGHLFDVARLTGKNYSEPKGSLCVIEDRVSEDPEGYRVAWVTAHGSSVPVWASDLEPVSKLFVVCPTPPLDEWLKGQIAEAEHYADHPNGTQNSYFSGRLVALREVLEALAEHRKESGGGD